jgi:hypothetical protein
MTVNWLDIASHTLPTMAVAMACAWMTDFGLRSATWPGSVAWIAIAWAFLAAFMAIWPARERRQHGGTIPSQQSRLEAHAPKLSVFVYVASTYAFWKFEL